VHQRITVSGRREPLNPMAKFSGWQIVEKLALSAIVGVAFCYLMPTYSKPSQITYADIKSGAMLLLLLAIGIAAAWSRFSDDIR
jgi:hypothetical protein